MSMTLLSDFFLLLGSKSFLQFSMCRLAVSFPFVLSSFEDKAQAGSSHSYQHFTIKKIKLRSKSEMRLS